MTLGWAVFGLAAFGVAALAMSAGVMHALDTKHEDSVRLLVIETTRASRRRDAAIARQEARLAELTFWEYEQRQRRFEHELEGRRRARRKR